MRLDRGARIGNTEHRLKFTAVGEAKEVDPRCDRAIEPAQILAIRAGELAARRAGRYRRGRGGLNDDRYPF